ncbi:serine protease [Mesorhizobium carmichaelinearum]|uniref:serine protease n=1 Tax=Mesorhizobium carmichaelinearum TaxID=1208188 RepID=UPI000BA2D3EA|nr:serine protease [Mesorhizobium carmichaelinearum]
MRVHSDVPKTVVFIGTEVGGRFNPLGTGFLGNIEYKGSFFNFVITAKHVIDLAGSQAVVRLNQKERGPIVLPLDLMQLSDPIHDLAVISIALPDTMDQFCLPLGRAVHLDALERKLRPDLGDEVATVGLYSSHHGITRNVPVVRIGNIARMPDDELVRSNSGGYISAYLVETKSILGLSGSPVFVNVPRFRFDEDGSMQTLKGARIPEFPIGVMIGYHLVRSAEDQIAVPHDEDADPGPDTDERNTGFAVVVPIERVFDLLEKPELVAEMDETVK